MKTEINVEISVTDISPTIREVASGDGVFNILTLLSGVNAERSVNIPLGEIQALIDALTIVRDAASRATTADMRVSLIDREGDVWRPVPGSHDAYALFIRGRDEDTIKSLEYIRDEFSPLTRADNGEPFA